MKFTADTVGGNAIRSYQPGEIRIGDDVIRNHIIVSREHLINNWAPPPIRDLSLADLAPALDLTPEILLLGTGTQQQFPGISLLTEL